MVLLLLFWSLKLQSLFIIIAWREEDLYILQNFLFCVSWNSNWFVTTWLWVKDDEVVLFFLWVNYSFNEDSQNLVWFWSKLCSGILCCLSDSFTYQFLSDKHVKLCKFLSRRPRGPRGLFCWTSKHTPSFHTCPKCKAANKP